MAIICLILLSLYNSSHKLSISEYDINSTRLSSEFDGFRIVQLSDLHGAEFGDALYEKVRDLQPDIIALTGDFITTAEDLPAVERLVSKLVTLTDVYYISGNHDYGSGEIDALAEILDRYGVTFLRNEYEIIDRDGAQLVVAGVEDPNSWADMIQPEEFAEGIRTEYPDTFTLLLSHRNVMTSLVFTETKLKSISIMGFIAMSVAFIIYFVLIPKYGVGGCVIGFTLHELIHTVFYYVYFFPVKFHINSLRIFSKSVLPVWITYLAICIATAYGLSGIVDSDLIAAIIKGAVFGVAAIIATWFILLNRKDKDMILSHLPFNKK